MSRLPALTDPDFIRLSFAHFEERCHMGGLFFSSSLRCSWQMELEVLGRQSTKQLPSPRLGGHQEHSRSLADPQRAQARDCWMGSTILGFSSFSGHLVPSPRQLLIGFPANCFQSRESGELSAV